MVRYWFLILVVVMGLAITSAFSEDMAEAGRGTSLAGRSLNKVSGSSHGDEGDVSGEVIGDFADQLVSSVGQGSSSSRQGGGGLLGFLSRGGERDSGREIFLDSTYAAGSNQGPIIAIDAGHGGSEDGAHGVDGVLEKEVTLNIAFMLDELLRERLRADTLMIRREDVDISLADRTAAANAVNADLFISIHTNASEYKNLRGVETYYLDNTQDKSSLRLAERENASLIEEGMGDLGFMLSDLIQTGKTPESVALAHRIQDSLTRMLQRYYPDVRGLGVKKAPFYVLVGAHMPCVLVEVSFIDHPVEGQRLISKRYQKLAALGIFEGIREYFATRK